MDDCSGKTKYKTWPKLKDFPYLKAEDLIRDLKIFGPLNQTQLFDWVWLLQIKKPLFRSIWPFMNVLEK